MDYGINENIQTGATVQHKEKVSKGGHSGSNDFMDNMIKSTTEKGGFLDSLTFLEENANEVIEENYVKKFIIGNIRVYCNEYSENRCRDVIYYFNNDAQSVEDAYQELKFHIPMDAVKINERKVDNEEYVITFSSELFKEHYKVFSPNWKEYEGSFHLKFKISPYDEVFAATIHLGKPE